MVAWTSVIKNLIAPYFKLGASTGTGFLLAALLWVLADVVYSTLVILFWTVGKWLWEKALAYKERVLRLLNWLAYVVVALAISNFVILPYLNKNDAVVDQLMSYSGQAVDTTARFAVDVYMFLDAKATVFMDGDWTDALQVLLLPIGPRTRGTDLEVVDKDKRKQA